MDNSEQLCDASQADLCLSSEFFNNTIFDEKCGAADFKSIWKKE